MNHQIFISYKSDEIEYARKVKGNLESVGYTCWMAPDSIPGGSSYAQEIDSAIKNAEAILLVLSEAAMNSKWVEREVDCAINANKIILPFHIDSSELTSRFNFYLSCVQMYNAYVDWDGEFQNLVADLKQEGVYPSSDKVVDIEKIDNNNADSKLLESAWPDWEINERIGAGSTGSVYKIRRIVRAKSEYSALKVIKVTADTLASDFLYGKDKFEDNNELYRQIEEKITKEIEIMIKVKGNGNLVNYEDHKIIHYENGDGFAVLIRMELLTPLQKYLAHNSMSENDVRCLGKDICNALSFCEDNNIIHGDIKIENVFVTENGTYKLGDFSVSKLISSSATMSTQSGTTMFMAPEVAKNEKFDYRADQYSLGMLLFYLLNKNEFPFYVNNGSFSADISKANSIRLSGKKIVLPLTVDRGLAEAVEKACEYKPSNRYNNTADFGKNLEKTTVDINNSVKKKKSIIGITVAVLLLIIAVVTILVVKYKESRKFKSDEVLFYGDMCHITLVPDEESSLKNYQNDVEIIKERLNVFANDPNYLVEINEKNEIDVYTPESWWNVTKMENLICKYISRPSKLYAFDNDGVTLHPAKCVEIDRSYIDSIIVVNEAMTVSTAYDPIEADSYIDIKFTDEFVNDNIEELKSLGEHTYIGIDVYQNPWFILSGKFSEDYKHYYYLLDDEEEISNADLFIYNFTNEPLTNEFDVDVDFRTFTDWQKHKEADITGENQIDLKQLGNNTITIVLNGMSKKQGEIIDTETVLKSRLDAIGNPYSFGYIENEDYTVYVISTYPDTMDEEMAKILGSSSGFTVTSKNSSAYVSNVVVNNSISCELDSISVESLKNSNDLDVYLCISSIPYLSTHINEQTEVVSLTFDTMLNGEKIPTDGQWFYSFINEVVNTSISSSLSCFSAKYSSKDIEEVKPFISYSLFAQKYETAFDEKFNVKMCVLNNDTLSVYFDYYINENLPQLMTDTIKDIFDYVDVEHNGFINKINMYFIDENDDVFERARAFISYSKYSTEGNKVSMNGMFASGRLAPYKDRFLDIVNNDEFFLKYSKDQWATVFEYKNGVYSGN